MPVKAFTNWPNSLFQRDFRNDSARTLAERAADVDNSLMDRQSVIDRVRSHKDELQARGIARAALFGSTARDASKPGSDIDLVIELQDGADFSLIDHASVRAALEEWLGAPTDVLIWQDLVPRFRNRIAVDRVEIF